MTDEPPLPVGGPLARRLADQIRSKILRSCTPGEKLASEAALARRYKRSVTTVRKALSLLAGQGLILRKHGSGTYVSERLPRETGTTGLYFYGQGFPLLNESFARLAFQGLLDEVAETNRHIHLMLGYYSKPFAMTDALVGRMDLSRIDSLVCLEVFDQSLLQRLGEQLVTVSVDVACYQPGVSSCELDHAQSIELAVEHVWRLGHERIAAVGGVDPRDQDPAAGRRRDGFLKAMRSRGLRVDEDSVIVTPSPQSVAEWVGLWKSRPADRRATAVVAVGGFWPLARVLLHEGVRIPEQLSLIAIGDPEPWLNWVAMTKTRRGYWDLDLHLPGYRTSVLDRSLDPLRLMEPSAVNLAFEEMGQWAMQEALRRVQRPDLEPEHKRFPGSIKPGDTVTPPQ